MIIPFSYGSLLRRMELLFHLTLCSALISISGLVARDFENGTLLRTIQLDSTQPSNSDLDTPQNVFAIISEQIHISSFQIDGETFHCLAVHFNSLYIMVQLMHLFVLKH
jgi:hypothetical protein